MIYVHSMYVCLRDANRATLGQMYSPVWNANGLGYDLDFITREALLITSFVALKLIGMDQGLFVSTVACQKRITRSTHSNSDFCM